MNSASFAARQRRYHAHADHTRYSWATGGAYFAQTEARLLEEVQVRAGERLLEIGCGEGANLHHLRQRGAALFGVDYSPAKIAFARGMVPARLAVADAERLPFGDASFDVILIRDLLHHLPRIDSALAESVRVMRRGARLTLIEPNGRSPLAILQAAMIPAERGVLRSTAHALRTAVERAGLRLVSWQTAQPLPLARVLTHATLGSPRLAAFPTVTRTFDSLDGLAARVLPRQVWLYLVLQAVKP